MKTVAPSILSTPIQIGNVTIKNRLVVPAVSMEYCVDGQVTDRQIAAYESKAKGGFGAIIVEAAMIDENVRFTEFAAALWDDSCIEGQKRLVDAIHKHNCTAFLQLNHNGRQLTVAPGEEWKSVAPSPIPCPTLDVLPHELTIDEIHVLVERFGDGALRAKKSGYDGVELHGAHGYLIAEFMSSLVNKRYDEYGGSIDNRMRFAKEIIANIQSKCGEDFPILFRLSVEEFVPGGRTTAESKVVARMLEQMGVACIDISSSTYGNLVTYEPPMNLPFCTLGEYSAEIKKVVNVPVIVVGHVTDPRFAETMILSDQADLVAIGRASIADPELPNKFFNGCPETIRQCLSCNQGCVSDCLAGRPVSCMTNPNTGFEYVNEVRPAPVKKNVVVVGGGPAGILAAEGAALVGHSVTLYEKADRLGGAFSLAPVPPMKGQLSNLLSWHIAEIKRLGVTIKTGAEYTKADYEAARPDRLILATGTNPSKPPIKGIDGANVMQANDVLRGTVRTTKDVVIAGGGLVGAETALFLAEQHCKVTVVEMLPTIAKDEELTRRILLMQDLEKAKVQLITDARIEELAEDGVTITKDGVQQKLPCQTIVLALGVRANNALYEQLKGEDNITLIGDGKAPVNALQATRWGYVAGLNA